jgi:eukaryotic-like serine/threonine-protein kinase
MDALPFGPYTLTAPLGEGGMAVTFKATERLEHIDGERVVAVKQILPSFSDDEAFRRMFLDEARLTAKLSHQNICKIYTAGEVDNTLFIAMEFVDGVDLWKLMRRAREDLDTGFPLPHALHVTQQILQGLHAAHTATDTDGSPLGLVHRDVSPQNILLSRNGEVKVIDFGVAKARTNSAKTAAGMVKGKVMYLSPEQLRAEPLDARSDLFAVGLILYELVTGIHPLAGESDVQTVHNYYNMEIVPPSHRSPGVPRALDTLVMRALASDPAQRWISGDEMAQAVATGLARIHPGYTSRTLREFVDWALDDESVPYELPGGLTRVPATPVPRPPTSGRRRVRTVVEDDVPEQIRSNAELVAGIAPTLAAPLAAPPPSPEPAAPPAAPPSPAAAPRPTAQAPHGAAAGPHVAPPAPDSHWAWYLVIAVLSVIAIGCLGFFGLAFLSALFGNY